MTVANRILIVLFYLCTTFSAFCQFDESHLESGWYFYGPENVNFSDSAMAQRYILELLEYRDELMQDSITHQQSIAVLSSQNLNAAAQSRKSSKIISRIERISVELKLINRLLVHWEKIYPTNYLLTTLQFDKEKGRCLEIYSSEGVVYGDEILLQFKDIKSANTEEVLATYQQAGSRWEKKLKNENCLSPNLEDCYVYCLIDKKEAYLIQKRNGEAMELTNCPDGGVFQDRKCVNEFIEEASIVRSIILADTNEIIDVVGYSIVDCQE